MTEPNPSKTPFRDNYRIIMKNVQALQAQRGDAEPDIDGVGDILVACADAGEICSQRLEKIQAVIDGVASRLQSRRTAGASGDAQQS